MRPLCLAILFPRLLFVSPLPSSSFPFSWIVSQETRIFPLLQHRVHWAFHCLHYQLLYFFLSDQDPRGKSLDCAAVDCSAPAQASDISRRSPSVFRRPRPRRPARGACLIDLDTWVSFRSVSFHSNKSFNPIHPLFPRRIALLAQRTNASSPSESPLDRTIRSLQAILRGGSNTWPTLPPMSRAGLGSLDI